MVQLSTPHTDHEHHMHSVTDRWLDNSIIPIADHTDHLNFFILECRNFAAFYLAFSECSTGICQAFDGQTEFMPVPAFNFVSLSYSWNS